MNLRMFVTVCGLVSVGAGCSLRKELPGSGDAGIVNLPDSGSPDVARDASPAQGFGGNSGPSGNGGSGGPSSAPGGAGVGTGGAVAAGTGGGGGATGGAQTGTDSGVDGPLSMRGVGEACSSKDDCTSGNCADGVCCDTACADNCSACDLANFAGHCSPVAAGGTAPAPHPACPKMPASTCLQNGLCDGKGACQMYAGGQSCADGACSATTQMSVTGSTCDGVGACKAAPAVPCSPFKCKADGTACATTCAIDADCQGQPCVAGSCGKVANGNKCTSAGQCTSGNCVDGYCCDSACGGSCQACDLAGSIGKCMALAANQTPRNGRAACAAGTCGSRCDGASTSCVFASKTTSCGAASCSGGTAKAAVSCDGMGACPTAATTSCGGYACSGATCKTTCTADADCVAPTPYCSGGKCQAAKPLGRACATGSECAMGNCVNGVCCGTASCPTCQACNLGTPGTCTAKPVGTPDSACTTANCQTGTCNATGACGQAADGAMCGTNRFCRGGTCGACTPNQTCQPPTHPCKTGTTSCTTGSMVCLESGNVGAGTPCGAAASCTLNTKTNAAVCNGGTCSATTVSCPNGCNPAKTDCLTCSAGQAACSSGCTSTDGDPQNCGGCNLKCPTGSLCKSGLCEVRVGYPSRFTGNEASPFQATLGQVTASSLTLAKQSTLLALGFINASTTAGAVATFGLYNDSAGTPGALVASAADVSLHSSVQEIAVSNVVLVPGTYYFAILTRDDGEPKIYTSLNASPSINIWYGGPASYQVGLPASFGSLASEVFSGPLMNVYLVVTQPGG